MSIRWTDAEKLQVWRTVQGAASTDEAVRLVHKVFPKRGVTRNSIDLLLRDAGRGSLVAAVLANVPDKATPVEILRARQAKDAAKDARDQRDQILRELERAHEQIEVFTALSERPPTRLGTRSLKGKNPKQRQGIPVMLCSDWHVEEGVDPAKVNGLNEYDMVIADRCIKRMAEAFEWMLRDKRFDCREAIIWLGGDLFSGYIHEELEEANFLSPIRALLWLEPRIESMLRTIARDCPNLEKILVVCNDGNHGRTTHKIRVATRTDNSYEYLLYQHLAARLQDDPRFVFQIAEGEHNYVDVHDQTLCFFHGDSVRYMGGVGGLIVPMRRGLNELRKYRKVDVFNFGHFHTGLDLPEMVGNGSMIGITPYSMRNKCEPQKRQQRWYLMDSKEGKCLSAPIWL